MRVKMTEAQFVRLIPKAYGQGAFYRGNGFEVSFEEMDKQRKHWYPYYESTYGNDFEKLFNQITFSNLIHEIDEGRITLPKDENGWFKYHTLDGTEFSVGQLQWYRDKVRKDFEGKDIHDLYDTMILNTIRNMKGTESKSDNSLQSLYDNGFFKKWRNGEYQIIADICLGKKEMNDFVKAWLSKTDADGKTNKQRLMDDINADVDHFYEKSDNPWSTPKEVFAFDKLRSLLIGMRK